jgi:hypothetical protein
LRVAVLVLLLALVQTKKMVLTAVQALAVVLVALALEMAPWSAKGPTWSMRSSWLFRKRRLVLLTFVDAGCTRPPSNLSR